MLMIMSMTMTIYKDDNGTIDFKMIIMLMR